MAAADNGLLDDRPVSLEYPGVRSLSLREGAKATGWHPPHPSSFPRRRQSPTGSHSALTSTFPPDLVDQVIEQTGRTEQRRRLLPARVVVYWVLALAV